ncbi:protein LTV1 homolog [Uloborus diversus]|uniref:protein LTV1 homolog n=1 Tax=Uloborus diversus TaxID=327109 RepID=UPI002409E07D|nr:protein LTV1 homolog [Uloborus diversus]
MPHRKKRIFTKENSVKFLLLHGNTEATNADGETLENVFVPVSKNYKPGTSLLASQFANICGVSALEDDNEEEPDLEKIMGEFDDSDCDEKVETLVPKLKKLCLGKETRLNESGCYEKSLEFNFGNESEECVSDQFSDVSSDDVLNEYPLTSATINCPDNIKTFNERFEKLMEEYDDDQIGALDEEEICGNLSVECERVQNLIDSSKNAKEIVEIGNTEKCIKEKILHYAEADVEEKYIEIVTEKPIEHDCESILSTYSNIYNHPAIIKEESKIQRIKIPNNPFKKLTKSDLKRIPIDDSETGSESEDNVSIATSFNIRPRGETPEQRKERKNLFKEAKRESRMLKKENKLAFKEEKKLRTQQAINARRNKGIRLL